MSKKDGVFVVGPADAAISKIKDVYRKCFFVKSDGYDKLISVKDDLEKMRETDVTFKGKMEFDFDH